MLLPVLVTPPAETPISLQEAKDHLRVTEDGHDALITGHIKEATSYLDGYSGILGRCLVTQRWRQDAWSWQALRLPFPHINKVAIKYRDAAGTEHTVDSTDHRIEVWASGTYVLVRSGWPTPGLLSGGAAPVSVEFDAGYGSPELVPAAIKRAIKIHVEAMHDGLPKERWRPSYDSMISGFRVRKL